ncbi:peroxiredoxin family protein [Blastopirellula marina]|nr:peroxiredoxin family protein [Blastopirellula marina]
MFSKSMVGLSLALVTLFAVQAPADELKVGDKAPTFTLDGEGADPVKLADFKGKKLVICFNRANWCPFCMKQVTDLQKHYDAIKDAGAEVLVVFREEATGAEGLKKIREKTKATMPFALDLQAEKTGEYSPEGFDTYILDEEGKITAVLEGTKPDRPLGDEILSKLRN